MRFVVFAFVTLLAVTYTGIASAADIYYHLIESEIEIDVGDEFGSTISPIYYADDFYPDSDYEFTKFSFHAASEKPEIPVNLILNVEIYHSILSDAPVYAEDFGTHEFGIINTGWYYEDYPVFRIEVDIPPTTFISVTRGEAYWSAYNMEHDDDIFFIGQNDVEGLSLRTGVGGNWVPYTPDIYDVSMRCEGTKVGIDSASLGQIKAVFK